MSQGEGNKEGVCTLGLDYLFYGKVRGSLALLPPLPGELWGEKISNKHSLRHTHTHPHRMDDLKQILSQSTSSNTKCAN